MAPSTDIRQRAKDLVDQLPDSSLQQVVTFLEALQTPSSNLEPPSEPEANLLATIQWQLAPEEQTRLDYLRQSAEAESLTPEEHQEFLSYADLIEQRDAQRAEALLQLAQLRQVPLEQVLAEFLPAHAA
jgi:hypothetical protein